MNFPFMLSIPFPMKCQNIKIIVYFNFMYLFLITLFYANGAFRLAIWFLIFFARRLILNFHALYHQNINQSISFID